MFFEVVDVAAVAAEQWDYARIAIQIIVFAVGCGIGLKL